ncbi:MAG: hypothetical protein UY15_C0012G0022 [Parcubacteria group bacterium GW2011_GWA2_47_9]|nr:MAG: hypothetical protein UY15_C0012G0022 [Parcubacteria group bacterium GW2011_GWA2_47_9]
MQKIQCPNCQSYKTLDIRKTYGWGGVVFAILSIPWIFILIGIPFLLGGIAVAVYGFTKPKGFYKCRNCHNEWMESGEKRH